MRIIAIGSILHGIVFMGALIVFMGALLACIVNMFIALWSDICSPCFNDNQKHSYPCFYFLGFFWILLGIHCYPQHPKQDLISIGKKVCRKLVKKLPQN
jgi:hypothetical protein